MSSGVGLHRESSEARAVVGSMFKASRKAQKKKTTGSMKVEDNMYSKYVKFSERSFPSLPVSSDLPLCRNPKWRSFVDNLPYLTDAIFLASAALSVCVVCTYFAFFVIIYFFLNYDCLKIAKRNGRWKLSENLQM